VSLNRRVNVGDVPIALPADAGYQLSVRRISTSRLISSEIRYGAGLPNRIPTSSKHNDDAYSVGLTFQEQKSTIIVDGAASQVARHTNQIQILYIPAVKSVQFHTPRHDMEIRLRQSFIREISEDLEVPKVTHVGRSNRHLAEDPALMALALRMYPFFDSPDELDPLQADHFMWALGVSVCARYGDLAAYRPRVGALSTWQERLAKDAIETCLNGGIGLAELAGLCGLRTSQFAHAFKRSTGIAPYRWLQHRRISRAMDLLRAGGRPLADVALMCGFADQSHLTRAFVRDIGATPGAWRAAALQ